jgi:hypothetical protein
MNEFDFAAWAKENIPELKGLPYHRETNPDLIYATYRGRRVCLLALAMKFRGYVRNAALALEIVNQIQRWIFTEKPCRYGGRNWITNNGTKLTH